MAEEVKDTTVVTETHVAEAPKIDYEVEYKKLLADNKKLKDATDRACSDAAAFKKQLREKQTEQERIEAERAEADAKLREELDGYRTASRISGYANKLMDCGYDKDTAMTMAKALPDGMGDDFFAGQKVFLDNQRKSIEAQLLNTQPSLSVGKTPSKATIDSDEDAKMREWFGLK